MWDGLFAGDLADTYMKGKNGIIVWAMSTPDPLFALDSWKSMAD